jgi:hypothetical protein
LNMLRIKGRRKPAAKKAAEAGALARSILLVVFSAMIANIAARAQALLTIGNTPGYPGATSYVPVLLAQATNIVAAQFEVSFVAGNVSVGSAVSTTAVSTHTVKSRQIAPGVIRTLVYSLKNIPLSGSNDPIAELPFAVSSKEHVGSGPLTPGNVLLAKGDATALLPVRLSGGTIFVRLVNVQPGGSVQFFLRAAAGQPYVVQASADLTQWVSISTNIATSNFLDLLDTDSAKYPYRFYRDQRAAP